MSQTQFTIRSRIFIQDPLAYEYGDGLRFLRDLSNKVTGGKAGNFYFRFKAINNNNSMASSRDYNPYYARELDFSCHSLSKNASTKMHKLKGPFFLCLR